MGNRPASSLPGMFGAVPESGEIMIELQPFCSESDLRPNMQKPWSRDGFTFATDGRILVRVSSTEYPVAENEAAPEASDAGPFNHNSLETEWIPVPDIPEPMFSDCRKCKGTGKSDKCRECCGDGRHECDCGHEHDCGECDGTGYSWFAEKCDNCENGKVEETQQVAVGEAVVNAVYLRKIADLPNPEFARPTEWDKPIAFKFNGGVGYLMPMRK